MKNLDESKYKAYGYDGRVLRTSLCPTGRMNKVVDNEKTLPTTIVHTHRLLAHIPTRLNNNYFLTVIKPLKSNTYSEATTQYFFCPSATPFIEASGGDGARRILGNLFKWCRAPSPDSYFTVQAR